ncbi:MAG: prolyl oligopeptidase family serine peptidase [Saprospiraceae bacterium]|nr:prolyl oligopeptidase family serine peptidase [Saprospiraceae bacterium]
MKWSLTSLLFFSFLISTAQSKKPLDHSVYDSWQRIGSRALSNEGNILAYTVDPQEGDGTLFIQFLSRAHRDSIPRGYGMAFSKDNRILLAKIKPGFQETRKAKIAKKKIEDQPKDSLLIYDLVTFSYTKIPGVRSFVLPEEGSGVFVYHMEKNETDTSKSKKSDTNTKDGTTLVIHSGPVALLQLPYVLQYALSKSGTSLVIKTSGSKSDSTHALPIVLRVDTKTLTTDTLARGNIEADKFAWDENGRQLAFIATRDSAGASVKRYHLRFHTPDMDTAQIRVQPADERVPPGMQVSEHSNLRFSKDGRRLFFGISKIPVPRDTSVPDFEQAKLDIWHYQDDYLQPMQLRNLDQELKKNYLAMSTPDAPLTILGDDQIETIVISNEENGRFALGRSDKGLRIPMQWEGDTREDIYLFDLQTGSKKLVRDDLDGNAYLSPGGEYLIWYDLPKKMYFTHHNTTGNVVSLNQKIKPPLADEENDLPDDPAPYGICGWSEGDVWVFLYDRYDIWRCDPKGIRSPVNITAGWGRQHHTQLRNVVLDPKQLYFKPDQILLLSALDDLTKERGFYSIQLNKMLEPKLLTKGGFSYGPVLKAKNSDVFAYTKGNFIINPDIHTSRWFEDEKKQSAINPQQSAYNWGSVEMISWETFKGKKTQGLLYKPEDFDPNRKYPMIVYFYEKLTDNRFNYQPPAPTPSRLNIPFFVSRGYLVFTPDISYEIGYPGPSAYDHIVSGVNFLKKNTWVDSTNIGLQGQSWGGYQALYVITQTNQFKAAWTGAPVVNMFSAYGGIRWESGRNRQMQYEKSQSRLGATPWQRRDLYIENSPLFYLEKINSPLVIMANDADGAVPWYQGIELFTALRRLDKKVWMLNYNGEAHNLTERRNQKDISIREQQFFDHQLKGQPAPEWLIKGVPAVEKGKNWGFEIKKKS